MLAHLSHKPLQTEARPPSSQPRPERRTANVARRQPEQKLVLGNFLCNELGDIIQAQLVLTSRCYEQVFTHLGQMLHERH